MGAQQCRCDCNCEKECTRLASMIGYMGFLFAGIVLVMPYMWANPFDGEGDGECSNGSVVPMAVALPCILLCVGQCFCLSYGSPQCEVLDFVGAFAFLCLLVAEIVAIASLALHATCSEDSRVFILSVSLLLLVPSSIACLGCYCEYGPGASDLRRALGRCGRTVANPKAACGPKVGVARIPRAQKLLRDALMLGDAMLVDLLVDFCGRRQNLLWRLYRCVVLSCMHCQLKCACCMRKSPAQEEDGASSTSPGGRRHSVHRARLCYTYEDDGMQMPVHYLARGARKASASSGSTAAGDGQRGSSRRRCCRRLPRHLPELTDQHRARLMADLLQCGRLDAAALAAVDAQGQTPLHCAASTGSRRTLGEMLAVCGCEAPMLRDSDAAERTPCEVALQKGHLECASMLMGPDGHWLGLSKLPRLRTALRECLTGALGRLRPMGPVGEQLREEVRQASLVHEGSSEVLSHLEAQLSDLLSRTGGALPREAADALLRFHRFNVDDAVAAYERDPRSALDAAGLGSIVVPQAVQLDLQGDQGPSDSSRVCMVCFDAVAEEAACRELACGHLTCDECLRRHVAVQLEQGDVAKVICPEPSCRLPISDSMVQSLFGAGQELERLQNLKAQKFVDASGATAWCPKPGCGRAVSLIHGGGSPSSSWRPQPATVECACGTRFCFSCKELGGHEPVGCGQWKAWLADWASMQREMADASERWVSSNSCACTCGANIERNGGCNHMICTVCGRHFCYACGKDWSQHTAQRGGMDFYNCGLGPGARGSSPPAAGREAPGTLAERRRLERVETCLRGWAGNDRDPEWHEEVTSALLCLAQVFELSAGFQAVLTDGSAACLAARQILQRCYVLKYHWGSADWRRHLQSLVGELEQATGALESALGFVHMDAALVRARPSRQPRNPGAAPVAGGAAARPRRPYAEEAAELLRGADLRQCVPHALAASEAEAAIRQLATAVVLQRARLLGVARAHAGTDAGAAIGGLNSENISNEGNALGSGRCSLM